MSNLIIFYSLQNIWLLLFIGLDISTTILHKIDVPYQWIWLLHFTGGNRTMVAAATIVIMAAADGERISIFPLVCPDKDRGVLFSAPDI